MEKVCTPPPPPPPMVTVYQIHVCLRWPTSTFGRFHVSTMQMILRCGHLTEQSRPNDLHSRVHVSFGEHVPKCKPIGYEQSWEVPVPLQESKYLNLLTYILCTSVHAISGCGTNLRCAYIAGLCIRIQPSLAICKLVGSCTAIPCKVRYRHAASYAFMHASSVQYMYI